MRPRGIFFLPLLLLLGACAGLPVLPPPPSPEELLGQVRLRQQKVEGLKGMAEVKVVSALRRVTIPEVLFARRPASLRAESLGPLGTPQLYLVADEGQLSIYIPAENRYHRGTATAGHLSSILPVALPPQEAVEILLGGVPLRGDYERVAVAADRQEGLWILELESAGEQQRIWVQPGGGEIVKAEFRAPGQSRRLVFSDFQRVQGILFPKRLLFTSQAPRLELAVEYGELELNPRWGADDFRLPVPAGAVVLPLPED